MDRAETRMAESPEEVIAETIHEKTRGCEDAGCGFTNLAFIAVFRGFALLFRKKKGN
ncbi:hypothetical protein WN944_024867 [Citrus x changshan-huyou]|uniref:Uncharacterized protein n=1 Tax=Citrus x changshan-huyou TaxID=2935761 RepID=A0AAP0QB04_9ROSI